MSPHNSPVLCFFFGAIKLPATSSFPCPRLSLSLRPGRPTALWEKGCPPPAGGRRAECSLWTSLSQSCGFSSQGSSRPSPGTQDTRVPGSLVRPSLPQTLASFPEWALLFPQPRPLLRAKSPASTPLCSSTSPDSARPCHPEAPLRTHLILCPVSSWSICEEAPQSPQGPPPVPMTTAQVWPRVRLGSQFPASLPHGLSQAQPQALPCSTAFTGSPLLSPRPQCATPTALASCMRPAGDDPRQARSALPGRPPPLPQAKPRAGGLPQQEAALPLPLGAHNALTWPLWVMESLVAAVRTPGSLSAWGRQLPLKSRLPPPL